MDHPTPEQPDLTLLLSRDAYWQAVHHLHTSLPSRANDTPEDLARRDNAAIAKVACLLPANAAETDFAAQYVTASAHAMEDLRCAQEYARTDHTKMLRCQAQAARMMRQAATAIRTLLRLQAVREKREKDRVATDKAAWLEHCTIGIMAQALPDRPPAAPMEPPAAAPEPEPEPAPAEDDEPKRNVAKEADLYAVMYPRRAAEIRKLGRLPDNPRYGPPEPWLVQALVNGRTPALLALDQ